MSVLQKIYELTKVSSPTVRPTADAKFELRLLTAIFPLLHADLRRRNCEKMLCSDASMERGTSLYSEFKNVHVLSLIHI